MMLLNYSVAFVERLLRYQRLVGLESCRITVTSTVRSKAFRSNSLAPVPRRSQTNTG